MHQFFFLEYNWYCRKCVCGQWTRGFAPWGEIISYFSIKLLFENHYFNLITYVCNCDEELINLKFLGWFARYVYCGCDSDLKLFFYVCTPIHHRGKVFLSGTWLRLWRISGNVFHDLFQHTNFSGTIYATEPTLQMGR